MCRAVSYRCDMEAAILILDTGVFFLVFWCRPCDSATNSLTRAVPFDLLISIVPLILHYQQQSPCHLVFIICGYHSVHETELHRDTIRTRVQSSLWLSLTHLALCTLANIVATTFVIHPGRPLCKSLVTTT